MPEQKPHFGVWEKSVFVDLPFGEYVLRLIFCLVDEEDEYFVSLSIRVSDTLLI